MNSFKSEKQLQTEQRELIKDLQKPFFVFVMPTLLDWDLVDLQETIDGEYIEVCKEEGRIYSLEDFTKAFNEGEIDPSLDYIRILKD